MAYGDNTVEDLLSGPLGCAVAADLSGVTERDLAHAVGIDLGYVPYARWGHPGRKHWPRLPRRGSSKSTDHSAAGVRWDRATELVGPAVANRLDSLRGLLSRTDDAASLLRRVGTVTENFAYASDWLRLAPALAAARAELRPVSELLAASPAAAWWMDPMVRASQRWLAAPGAAAPSADRLSRGLVAAVDEQAARAGGWWSSSLVRADVIRTTRGDVPRVPAVALACREGYEVIKDTVAIWSVEIGQKARVYEIRTAGDWGNLARSYPRRLAADKRHEWTRLTGIEEAWVVPDWLAARQDWDGVHISLGGYLAAAYQAIDTGDGFAFLAGWNPDETLWLNAEATPAARIGEVDVQ